MSVSSCFKRTNDKVSPHNAVLLGDKLVAAIESKNYRTDLNESSLSVINTPVEINNCTAGNKLTSAAC